jgi:hypothetical protein
MKSIVALTTQRIVLILAIATVVAVPAVAKEGNWKLDADHSTAQILVGTNAFNIGVAHVDGTVELDATQPTDSVLDLSIDQAGGKLITFRSQRATMNRDGKLQVSGYLTLRRVVREVYLNAGEDYHGPVYGEPAIETVTRQVMFVLPMEDRGEKSEIAAEANIFRENFPELFAAVNDLNWQPVIQDKACEMPRAGEDYAGALCTGTVVESDRSLAFASGGEDYHGFEASAPTGNLVIIVLNLHLTRENPERAMAAGNLR